MGWVVCRAAGVGVEAQQALHTSKLHARQECQVTMGHLLSKLPSLSLLSLCPPPLLRWRW